MKVGTIPHYLASNMSSTEAKFRSRQVPNLCKVSEAPAAHSSAITRVRIVCAWETSSHYQDEYTLLACNIQLFTSLGDSLENLIRDETASNPKLDVGQIG